jgi:hypothetical protein
MKSDAEIRLALALAVLAAWSGALGQAATSGSMVMASRSRPDTVGMQLTGAIVREIDDPHTGARWLLMRDSSHPGGPGRMELASEPRSKTISSPARNRAQGEAGQYPPATEQAQPVIRAGDRVIVEEDTPVVEARLEAVALNPAAVGSSLRVRMIIGGRLVRAVALAPGRAGFQAEIEAGQ